MLSMRTAVSRAAGVRALSTSAARMGAPKPIDDSTSALDCELGESDSACASFCDRSQPTKKTLRLVHPGQKG